MLSHFNKMNMILSSKSSLPKAVDFPFSKHFTTAHFVKTEYLLLNPAQPDH